MKIIARLFNSSLGKKYIMATTGLVLFLFVVGHLAGNLQIFFGPEVLNRYGYLLQSNVELLWPVRIVLLIMVGLHIWSASRLTIDNRAARGVAYEGASKPYAATYASRTMMMSGLIVAAFIIYHLLHFTVQTEALNFVSDPALRNFKALHDEQGHHDVYAMMVAGFSNRWVSLFYIVAVALLCLHLSHGLSAMLNSLGLRNRTYSPIIVKGGKIIALAIFIGYASIPAAVMLGYGKSHLNAHEIPELHVDSAAEAAN